MKKVVVLTGAGISAESGIATFRDANGLWEGHDVMEVASPQGWQRDQATVLEFYNQRRKQGRKCKANEGHIALAKLEEGFEVVIITQNIDNLHEQAQSSKVIHLHGEIFKAQSTANPNLVYDLDGKDINLGDKCELGSQLRPFIVWFGEAVPKMEEAIQECLNADVMLIVGTSLQVYPAASLYEYIPLETPIYYVDPGAYHENPTRKITHIKEKASTGVPKLVEQLLTEEFNVPKK